MSNKKVACIFDIETSDKRPIGQILSLSYIIINDNFEVLDKKTFNIKISRWSIPHPEAIAVNKIDVLKHKGEYSEKEALEEFDDAIDSYLMRGYEVYLTGQNITGFDLDYIRSNRLRCGLRLYGYYQKCYFTDLMFLSKKLFVCNEDFRKKLINSEGVGSISLNNLIHVFNLYEGEQKHESMHDVELTLEVFKYYNNTFNLNLFTYEPFELMGYSYKRGDVFEVYIPEISKGSVHKKLMFIHYCDKNYFLLGDLSGFDSEKGKQNLFWFKKKGKSLILHNTLDVDIRTSKRVDLNEHGLRTTKHESISNISMENYFPNLICDPEEHVTKLPFTLIDPLCLKMNNPTCKIVDKNYKNALNQYGADQVNTSETFRIRNYIFNLKENYEELESDDKDLVNTYIKDRYINGLLDKDYSINEFTINDENVTIKRSDSLMKMIEIAKQLFYSAKENNNKELKSLMVSWLKFVDTHEIYKIVKNYGI